MSLSNNNLAVKSTVSLFYVLVKISNREFEIFMYRNIFSYFDFISYLICINSIAISMVVLIHLSNVAIILCYIHFVKTF